MTKRIIQSLLIGTCLMALSSCSSVPKQVDQEWTEEMFFKSAQDAVDMNQLEVALFYYEVFLVRFPEDHAKTIAAEYERSLLYKKLGVEDLALEGMNHILNQFETSPYVTLFSPRYKILAEKIKLELEGKPLPEVDMSKYPERKIKSED